ncbi:MAG: 4Fe-4S [Geobacteraceae bacterium]|nr:MAG: 4Fe-4S [Geobacteraceae bacterium]
MTVGRIIEKLAPNTASVLKLDASRCLKMRLGESGCSRCATICPVGAIDLSDGLKIGKERCTGCLTCTTACPSGAIEAHEDFNNILSALARHSMPVFVVGCRLAGSRSHRQLPCLGMLSAEHLVGLYARGGAVVQLAANACDGCAAGAMRERLAIRLRETARTTRLPFDRRIFLVTKADDIQFNEPGLDRRSFFSSLRNLAVQGVTTALAAPAGEKRGLCYGDKSLPQRRAVLLGAIDSLPPEKARSVHDAFTFSASFNDSCDGCLGCVRACPTAAISETGDSTPSFDSSRCTGCRLCTEFCLSGAVDIVPCSAAAPSSAGT